jgi:hypothetical protein
VPWEPGRLDRIKANVLARAAAFGAGAYGDLQSNPSNVSNP